MSAGTRDPLLAVCNDLARLAPAFRAAVEKALAECNQRTGTNLHAKVYETWRSPQLAALYYERGRTIKPPYSPVTYAHNNMESWHGFGLAVDVVHDRLFWNPPGGQAWFRQVAAIFKAHGCNWGGDWRKPDPPHFQWAACPPSPSNRARELFAGGGVEAVWQAVGAA